MTTGEVPRYTALFIHAYSLLAMLVSEPSSLDLTDQRLRVVERLLGNVSPDSSTRRQDQDNEAFGHETRRTFPAHRGPPNSGESGSHCWTSRMNCSSRLG